MTTYEVQVRHVPTRTVAALRRHVRREEIGPAIQTGLGRLYEAVERTNAQPAGVPFAVFHEVTPENVDMELCIPVDGTFTTQGQVEAEAVPGGAVATTVHRGPYEAIAPAYDALTGWIRSHDAEIAGPPRELYLNDPAHGAESETEIEFPIA